MPLRDLIQKRDRRNGSDAPSVDELSQARVGPVPEIKFIRTDTHTQEVILPPSHDDEDHLDSPRPSSSSSRRRSLNPFHRSRDSSEPPVPASPTRPRGESRISHILHLDRDRRNSSSSSVNVPPDLPQINIEKGDEQDREAQWEKRATVLAQRSPQFGSPGISSSSSVGLDSRPRSRSSSKSRINDAQGDVNIQEAIRLHEAGELEKSTDMFAQLADPNGANNALSQVLYALALRHGWGCTRNPEKAVTYLSAAASNSASIESEALRAGLKKGGAAKGELVLAIFELGNCFRNGWGVEKDPVAARHYFETAANLGDTDAMNEVAWCFLEGFGGKKDKFMAAKYYRLAEEKGNKLVGNSWYVEVTSWSLQYFLAKSFPNSETNATNWLPVLSNDPHTITTRRDDYVWESAAAVQSIGPRGAPVNYAMQTAVTFSANHIHISTS